MAAYQESASAAAVSTGHFENNGSGLDAPPVLHVDMGSASASLT